jgi:class 3 adenylate cyclase
MQEIHDSIMREGIAKHGGYEIITEGDSFTIAFTTGGQSAKGNSRRTAPVDLLPTAHPVAALAAFGPAKPGPASISSPAAWRPLIPLQTPRFHARRRQQCSPRGVQLLPGGAVPPAGDQLAAQGAAAEELQARVQ